MLNSNLGYHGALLWIHLANRAWSLDRRPEEFFRQYPGGGLLATRLLLERTPPGIDPLGPENLLIFASSVLAGHPAAGLARFTVAGKSPLTGGIGETRVEGPWGTALKASGADAIIFTGVLAEPVAVLIEDGKVEFADGRGLWGLSVGQTTDRLEEQFGARIHVAVVGPAGEKSRAESDGTSRRVRPSEEPCSKLLRLLGGNGGDWASGTRIRSTIGRNISTQRFSAAASFLENSANESRVLSKSVHHSSERPSGKIKATLSSGSM